MRSRRSSHSQVAEVARRRLELLSAELAAIRPGTVDPPSQDAVAGSGEPSSPSSLGPQPSPDPGPPGRHARRPAGWVGDRLPATMQGRVRVGLPQLTVLAVLVAVSLGFLAWWSVRAADPGELVPARALPEPVSSSLVDVSVPTPAGPSPPSGAASGPAAVAGSAEAGEVVVDVAGKVRRPGIVRLPAGARVVDALEEAGGARRGVDLSALNLARVLVDGEQLLVGVRTVPGVAPSAAAGPVATPAAPLVNINTATAEELDTLPGVGPVTAAAILQWRADHGAFSAVEELLEVSGIGDATLAEMAPFVTL